MEWIAQFETGLEPIDSEHKGLVALINQVAAYFADARHVTRNHAAVVDTLADYAGAQFYDKEALMAEAGVDLHHIERQRAHHERFMEDIATLRRALDDQDPERFEILLDALASGLGLHLVVEDQEMARQLIAMQTLPVAS